MVSPKQRGYVQEDWYHLALLCSGFETGQKTTSQQYKISKTKPFVDRENQKSYFSVTLKPYIIFSFATPTKINLI